MKFALFSWMNWLNEIDSVNISIDVLQNLSYLGAYKSNFESLIYVKSSNAEEFDCNEMSSSSKQWILEIASDSILTVMSILHSLTNDQKAKETKQTQSLLQIV